MPDMNLILIGYRGCGKTTLGIKLAHQLWKDFVDTDQEACRRFGIDSIAEIWEKHGEPAWRDMEVQVTRDVLKRDNQVIALGGGTVMQPDARQAIADAPNARRIYLYCQPDELLRRIQTDAQTAAARPNLTSLGGGLAEVQAVLDERDPVYRQLADAVFNVTHTNPDEALRHLIARHL